MTEHRRLARALVRLYPRAWRARYEDEVLALVEQSGLGAFAATDLAIGAIREQWRDAIGAGDTYSARKFRVLLFMVGLTGVSASIAALATAAGLALPDRRVFDFVQALSLAAIARAFIGTRSRALDLQPTETTVWIIAAVVSAAVLQLPWPSRSYSTWFSNVHTGFGAALEFIAGMNFIVISLPAAARARRAKAAAIVVD